MMIGGPEATVTPAAMPLRSVKVDVSPAPASLHALDGVNFFLAGLLAGFGPYVAVYLADQKWTQEKIGFVLSAAALAGLLSQVPGGELLDIVRSKRVIVVLCVLLVDLSAITVAFAPSFPLVLIGLALQGITGGMLGQAIAAISLGLVGQAALPERLGRNQRFASTGSLVTAALMGLVAYISPTPRYLCWSSRSRFPCSLLLLASMRPTFTSVAPAELPITIPPIGRRGPAARPCGRLAPCLFLAPACFCFSSPTRRCCRLRERRSYIGERVALRSLSRH
jgi:MFS family permease